MQEGRVLGRRRRVGGSRSGIADLEHRHGTHQLLRLLVEAVGGGRGLLHQRRVLLRHLVELHHGVVDLVDAGGLLLGGGIDFRDQIGHAPDLGHDVLHGAARLGDQLAAGLHLLHAVADQRLDLLGRLGAAPGQAAHLRGHHGKTAALLARTCGLHGGVERQDVGLEGDAIDDADDVGDLLGGGVDLFHHVHDLLHHLAALDGHAAGGLGQLRRLLCGVRVGAHRAGELLHGGGRFLQVAGLLLGALGEVGVAHGDLVGARGNAVAAAAHRAHDLAQGLLHLLHGMDHAARPGTRRINVRGQVAGRDGACGTGHVGRLAAQLPGEAAGQHDADGHADQHTTDGQADQQDADVGVDLIGFVVELVGVGLFSLD